jgi:hypothetical protein
MRENISTNREKIRSITEYETRVSNKDSSVINDEPMNILLPRIIEYYNDRGRITRKEYYMGGKIIRNASNYIYEDDTLRSIEPDSIYPGIMRRTRYDYLPGRKIQTTSWTPKGDPHSYISEYNEHGNTIAEYSIREDTIYHTFFYNYDAVGNDRGMDNISEYHPQKSSFNYINNDTIWKTFFIDTSANLYRIDNYNYPDEFTKTTIQTNLSDSTTHTFTRINFRDQYENIYKTYFTSSKYYPNEWKIHYYLIEYAD